MREETAIFGCMKPSIDSVDCPPAISAPPVKFTIIYEDLASGLRAKNFAEGLAQQLGAVCHLSESFWRSDLLAIPQVAAEADRVAAGWNYLLVALCGDRISAGAQRWIEGQLGAADGQVMAVIALVGARGFAGGGTEHSLAGGGARRDLRELCAAQDVPFFCHAVKVPADGMTVDLRRRDETFEPERGRARWTPGWTPGWTASGAEFPFHHDLAGHR